MGMPGLSKGVIGMVAIVTGAGLGLDRSSALVLGSGGQLGSAAFNRYGENVYVNAATGNLIIDRTDEILVGQGPDDVTTSTYNSLGDMSDDNGDNWQLSVQRHVGGLTGTVNTTGSTITRTDWDGSEDVYTWDATVGSSGAYVCRQAGMGANTLTYASNVWTYTDGHTGVVEAYDSTHSGRITTTTDANGNQLTYTYTGSQLTRVTTADGEHTDISWSGSNITQIVTTLSGGATLTRVRYTYDGSNRLSTVTTDLSPSDNSISDGNDVVTTYTYDGSSKRVASIAQTGGALLSIAYTLVGSDYRVSSLTQTIASGVTRVTGISYNTSTRVTTITDPNSQTTELTYDTSGQLTQIQLPPAVSGGSSQYISYTYNSNGDVLTITDPSSNVTTNTYDSNDNLLTQTDALGNTVTNTYSASNRLLTQTTAPGSGLPGQTATTRYAYDSDNNLRFTVSADGMVTEYTYNSYGQQTSSIEYSDNLYSLTGLSSSTSIATSTLSTWASGISDRSTVVRTDTTYDFRGNVATVTNYSTASSSGVGSTSTPYTVVTYTYDQAGNLLTKQTSGVSNTETFTYDGLGRVTSAVDLNGGTTSMAFTDSTNTAVVTLANGLVQTSIYDDVGELLSFAQSGTGITTATTTNQYDDLGNLRMVTDPTSRTSYFLYDNVGRKVADIAADGSITEYRYDASNRLVATIAYATKLNSTQLSSLVVSGAPAMVALSSVLPSSSSGDLWTWRIYDADNRVIETIDGDGDATVFTYDNQSNVVSTLSYANVIGSSTVTGFKTTIPTTLQLPTADATHDDITRNFYDADGRLIGSLDATGHLSEINYNDAGEKIETIAFATAASSSYWATGSFSTLLTSVGTSSHDIHTRYFYDDRGLLLFTLDNALHPVGYVYDNAGNLIQTIDYAGSIGSTSTYTLSYVQGQITSTGLSTNTNNRNSWAVYDAAGRVAYAIDADGAVTEFGYDSMGRVIKELGFITLRSTTSSPSLSTMNSWATTYGSTTGNRTTRSFYDLAGRLVYSVDPEGYITENRYDTAGRTTLTIRYASSYTVTDSDTLATVAAMLPGSIPATAVQNSFSYTTDGQVSDSYDGMGIQTHYVYDALGRVTDKTVAYGTSDAATCHYVYDSAGRVSSVTEAYGATEAATTSYTYDGMGHMLTMVDPRGYTTSYTYDTLGHVLTVTVPIDGSTNAVTTNTYDAFGNLSTTVDPRGNTSYYFYDGLNRQTLAVDADGYATATSYTVDSQIASVTHYVTAITSTITAGTPPTITTNAADATTSFTYDKLGRVTQTTDALGNSESYTLDAFGNRLTVTNKLGGVTTNTYDRRGLLLTEVLPETSVTSSGSTEATSVTNTYTYDARGNRTQMVEASGLTEARTTNYTYDLNNRLIQQSGDTVSVNGQGLVTSSVTVVPTQNFAYDERGNLVATSDANDAITFYYYDHLNRKIAQVDAAGTLSTWTYDANGNVLTQRVYGDALTSMPTDPNSQVSEVYRLYDVCLGRLPTATEVANWIWRMNNLYSTATQPSAEGWPAIDPNGEKMNELEAICSTSEMLGDSSVQARLGSPSVSDTTFINNLYQAAFHRAPTSGEVTTWLSLIASGWTRAGMVADFCEHTDHRLITAEAIVDGLSGGTPPSPVNSGNYRETDYTYDRSNRLLTTTVSSILTGSYNTGNTTYSTATGNIVITNYYDLSGNVVRQVDGDGNSVWFYYDKNGNKIAEVDQLNYLTTYAMDANGNVLTESRFATALSSTPTTSSVPATMASSVSGNANDRITNFTYDKNGNRLTESRTGVTAWSVNTSSGALSSASTTSTVTYTYNALGEVLTQTEAAGDVTTYVYDTEGRQTSVTGTSFTDYTGNTTVQDTTSEYYDGLNDLTRTVRDSSRVTEFTYGAGGRMATMTDATGFVHNYYYDADGRQVEDKYTRYKSDGTTAITEADATRYDALGRVTFQAVATQAGNGSWSFGDDTDTAYDTYGDVVSRGVNGMSQETFSYDGAGRMWRSTGSDGVVKLYLYDGDGKQTLEVTSDGNTPSGYAWGNVTTSSAVTLLTGSGAHAIGTAAVTGMVVTITVDDARGQTIKTIEPLRELSGVPGNYTTTTITNQNTYNAFGEISEQTDALGYVTDFTYNTMGKVIEQQNPTVSYTDEHGNVSSARPTIINYYDLSGRVVGVEDANGNTNTRLLLVGTGYNGSDALVTKEFHPDGGNYTSGYDVYGDLRKTTNEVGDVETFTYDAMDRLLTDAHPTRPASTPGNSGNTSLTLTDTYGYDGLGQRVTHYNSELTSSVKETTDYDSEGRVTQTTDMGGHQTTYAYAWSGNISTTGLGTFGGWTKTTTNSTSLTDTLETDYFGRTVYDDDFGGYTITNSFDLAGRIAVQANNDTVQTSLSFVTGGAHSGNVTYSWFNTGMLASQSMDKFDGEILSAHNTWTIASTDTYSYGYDADGRRTLEGYEEDYGTEHDTTFYYSYYHSGGYVAYYAHTITQTNTATWDSNGRMTGYSANALAPDAFKLNLMSTTPPVTVTWEYDLDGNIRHVQTSYYNLTAAGAYGNSTTTQDDWYKYDSMNRFVVTQGTLSSGNITTGSNGETITYNKDGTRATMTDASSSEAYTYTADGYLAKVAIGNVTRATYDMDAMGRVTTYNELDSSGNTSHSPVYSQLTTYNNDSTINTQSTTSIIGSDTYTGNATYYYDAVVGGSGFGTYTGVFEGGAVTGVITTNTKNGVSQPTSQNWETYQWFGQAQLETTLYKPNNSLGNYTSSYYDFQADGTIYRAYVWESAVHYIWYDTDAFGQIKTRSSNYTSSTSRPTDYYYYFNRQQIGHIGNDGTDNVDFTTSIARHTTLAGTGNFRGGATSPTYIADFDESYDAINGLNAQDSSGHYTVQAGDTLQAVASKLWGDSSLWYLIAEANGLDGSANLQAGQSLIIPNKVHNVHNNADTYRVYDPNQAEGSDLSPTTPWSPAPYPHSGGCGIFGEILLAVVAIAVAVVTAGAALAAAGLVDGVGAGIGSVLGLAGAATVPTTALIAAGVVGGAVGSIVSQGVGLATGIQDKFSWSAVALSAIGGGVGAGLGAELGGGGALGAVERGVAGNVIDQGIGLATGLQSKFDWTSVAVAGVAAGVGYEAGDALGINPGQPNYDPGSTSYALSSGLAGAAGAIAGAGARSLITGTDFGDNIMAVLPDAIGQTIGNMIAGQFAEDDSGDPRNARFAGKSVQEIADQRMFDAADLTDDPATFLAVAGNNAEAQKTFLDEASAIAAARDQGLSLADPANLIGRSLNAGQVDGSGVLDEDGHYPTDVSITGSRTFGDIAANTLVEAQDFIDSAPEGVRTTIALGMDVLRGGPVGAIGSYALNQVISQTLSATGLDSDVSKLVTLAGAAGLTILSGSTFGDELSAVHADNGRESSLLIEAGVGILGIGGGIIGGVHQLGGAYRDVKGIAGYEAHHMPADSVSPLSTGEGPAIAMPVEDHKLTASWGNSRDAREYRQAQAALIEKGDFKAAQQMDIDDITAKFGNKYDDAITQMKAYTTEQGY